MGRHPKGIDPLVGTTILGAKILERRVSIEHVVTFICRCSCGKIFSRLRVNVTRAKSLNCGCKKRVYSYKAPGHGMTDTNEHTLLVGAKYRAKKKGLPFDLELADILIPEKCPILGTPMAKARKGEKSKRDFSMAPSLDRFDNSKGYTKDKIRVISQRANALKSNLTLETLDRLRAYMSGELR